MNNSNTLVGAGLLLAGAVYFLSSRKKGPGKQKGYPKGDADKSVLDDFDPNAGDPVLIPEASKLAKKYKKKYKDNTSSNYCNIKVIEDIKRATDCYGIRIYRTLTEGDIHGIVIVGVDETGRDITSTKDNLPYATVAVESYEKCPYNCDGAILIK